MTEEVAKAINSLAKRLNEVHGRIDAFFNEKAETNAGNIEVNAEGIDGLAEFADTNSSAIDDIGEILENLEERISALEGGN